MKTRTLPGTDLQLSVVGMGCWTIAGEHWGPTDDDESIATIRAAVESGIDWFDTAPLYGRGRADTLLRRALGSHIHRVTIATKVGVRWEGEAPEGREGHVWSDLRPAHVVADCEASVRRLKEPLDLLQVHWPCELGTPLHDTLEALDRLMERGLIRHWGLCNHGPEDVIAARRHGGIASLQTPYSLLRRELEGPLRDACTTPDERGQTLGILAYEVLCRGLLTGRYTAPPRFHPDDMRSWDERFTGRRFAWGAGVGRDLATIGRRLGVSGAAVALGWALSQPGITAVIAGARRPEQIRQSAQASRLLGHERIWRIVDEAVRRRGPPP